jgi:glycosyltransferase involved in cell wall biosynthesis
MAHNYLWPRPDPKLISIVMPFDNEGEMFPLLRPCLTEFLDKSPYPCEVIAVNDGSSDNTINLLFD